MLLNRAGNCGAGDSGEYFEMRHADGGMQDTSLSSWGLLFPLANEKRVKPLV